MFYFQPPIQKGVRNGTLRLAELAKQCGQSGQLALGHGRLREQQHVGWWAAHECQNARRRHASLLRLHLQQQLAGLSQPRLHWTFRSFGHWLQPNRFGWRISVSVFRFCDLLVFLLEVFLAERRWNKAFLELPGQLNSKPQSKGWLQAKSSQEEPIYSMVPPLEGK